MLKQVERMLVIYWLPISAALVGQGLAIRIAAESRGYEAIGGELMFLPAMYAIYCITRALPGIIEDVKEIWYGYEQ